jgi:hypothetical protein
MGYARHMFVSSISKEFICLSCEDVFRSPYTSPCGHSLCHDCWLNRVEQRLDDGEEIIVCMHCREQSIMSENKLKFNDDFHDAIMSMIVKCRNQECPKQMPLVNRELHMEVCRFNDSHTRLCCLKPSRRTSRIMRRGGRILKTVSRRALLRMCRTVLDRTLETYTAHINRILDPIAENLEAIEGILRVEVGENAEHGV